MMNVLNVVVDKHPHKDNVAESQHGLTRPKNCEVFIAQNLAEDQISWEGLNSKYTNADYLEDSSTADQFRVLRGANFVGVLLFPKCQVVIIGDLIHEYISRLIKIITVDFHDVLDEQDLVKVEIVDDLLLIFHDFNNLGSRQLSTFTLDFLLDSIGWDGLSVNSQKEIVDSLESLLNNDKSMENPED